MVHDRHGSFANLSSSCSCSQRTYPPCPPPVRAAPHDQPVRPFSSPQDVVGFAAFYTSKGLNSCYGPHPSPTNFTTFHARTYLQPQLNKVPRAQAGHREQCKESHSTFIGGRAALSAIILQCSPWLCACCVGEQAIRFSEKDIKGDKNPKDFILFDDAKFQVRWTKKDNTGAGAYVEGMVFPTLAFPSDHGITSTSLALKAGGGLRGV